MSSIISLNDLNIELYQIYLNIYLSYYDLRTLLYLTVFVQHPLHVVSYVYQPRPSLNSSEYILSFKLHTHHTMSFLSSFFHCPGLTTIENETPDIPVKCYLFYRYCHLPRLKLLLGQGIHPPPPSTQPLTWKHEIINYCLRAVRKRHANHYTICPLYL